MALDTVDPNDPTPGDRRQFLFGQGSRGGNAGARFVVLFGNKTSSGSETVETVGAPIADDNDMIARFGNRSEMYWVYWAYRQGDPTGATVFACAPAEAGGGTAGTFTLTFGATNADTATTAATATINWAGRSATFSIAAGDTTATQAANCVAAMNAADAGQWPFTGAQGVSSSTNVVTVTSANVGDRATYVLTPVTVTLTAVTGNTITKSAVTNGTGTDTHTLAYAAVATAGEYLYQVCPKSSVTTVTATDHGIGELVADVNQSIDASHGKEQIAYFGLVGTQAQATTTVTSANSSFAKFFRQKNALWTPGMLAGFHAGITWQARNTHPSYNMIGYTTTDSTSYIVPPAYSKADWATAAEIKADLNNGVCPIAFDSLGQGRLVREVTSKSLSNSQSDYRTREGHIPEALFFTWNQLEIRFADTRQPFIANAPASGQIPLAGVTYVTSVVATVSDLIDNLTGNKPAGLYDGPVLDPDSATLMKNSIKVTPTTGGGPGFELDCEFRAVKHFVKSATKLRETSPAQ
jgi:hypothetical protein